MPLNNWGVDSLFVVKLFTEARKLKVKVLSFTFYLSYNRNQDQLENCEPIKKHVNLVSSRLLETILIGLVPLELEPEPLNSHSQSPTGNETILNPQS